MIDRGNRVDWFDAQQIRIAVLIMTVGALGFLARTAFGTGAD